MLLEIALGCIFVPLILTTIFGNILMCTAILSDKKLRKPENLFLVSLAGSDILIAIFVMSFAAVNDVIGEWKFGAYCFIWLSLDVMCSTASILNLCAIGFDRYWHIKHPLKYGMKVSYKHIFCIIGFVWTIAGLVSFVPFSLGLHNGRKITFWGLGNNVTNCTMELDPIYAIVSSCISFFLPCLVMTVTYSQLYLAARQTVLSLQAPKEDSFSENGSVKRMKNRRGSIAVPRLSLTPARSHALQNGSKLSLQPTSSVNSNSIELQLMAKYVRNMRFNSDNKARRTIGVIMGIFTFCWFPFFTANIARAFCPTCVPLWAFQALSWLGYANSLANPIIYGICSRDFRIAFKRIIFCQRNLPKKKTHIQAIQSVSTADSSKRGSASRQGSPHNSQSSPDSTRLSLRLQIMAIFYRKRSNTAPADVKLSDNRTPKSLILWYNGRELRSSRSYGSCHSTTMASRTFSNCSCPNNQRLVESPTRILAKSKPMKPVASADQIRGRLSPTSEETKPNESRLSVPVRRQRAGSADGQEIQKQLGVYFRERASSYSSVDKRLFAV